MLTLASLSKCHCVTSTFNVFAHLASFSLLFFTGRTAAYGYQFHYHACFCNVMLFIPSIVKKSFQLKTLHSKEEQVRICETVTGNI